MRPTGMTRTLLGTAALAAALTVAGCGSSSSGGGGSSAVGPAGQPTGSPDPRHPAASSPAQAHVVPLKTEPASASRTGLHSIPWRYVAASGNTVTVELFISGCLHFDHATVTESGSAVEIDTLGTNPNGQEICPALAQDLVGTLTLDQSLGSRQLLHAPIKNGNYLPR